MHPAGRLALWLASATAAFVAAQALPLPEQQRIVISIAAAAMVMWVSEAYPLAATALASSLLLVLLAGRSIETVFSAYFDPVIVLLLGGFFLGLALTKHGLDAALAARVLRRFQGRPSLTLLAIMATTAVFSMWISNTAATAIMLPIALGTLVSGPAGLDAARANMARGLVLGVAAAANIGGVATPIGTTANPLAIRFLADQGIHVSFLDWTLRAVPLVVILVLCAWAILVRAYPPGHATPYPDATATRLTRRQLGVVAVFSLTVAAWMTSSWHGLEASTVALASIVALFATRLVGDADIGRAGWPTLLLIGGGLALGEAIIDSGVAQRIATTLSESLAGHPAILVFTAVAVVAIVLTTVASNTAAAVLMLPVAIDMSDQLGLATVPIVMLAAVSLSLDFLVPVGTPPNAMAHATGHASVRDMVRAGSLLTVAGVMVATLLAIALW